MKPKLTTYVKASSEFRGLLQEWVLVVKDYQQFWPTDCCWWYSERPALSLFSAAIWRHGGVALEEFSWSKRKSKRCKGYPGRCDLGFGLTRGKSKIAYEMEAKHVWCDYDKGVERMIRRTQRRMDEAQAAARRLHGAENPLAVVFASFSVKNKDMPPDHMQIIFEQNTVFREFADYFQDARAFGIILSDNPAHRIAPGCAVIIADP
ncbi:MAG TPA: hypothetical protein VEH27_15840 [Methylomirabilota bacterium]|nr:hypothetical protein [Methylomirabilota bacterium]